MNFLITFLSALILLSTTVSCKNLNTKSVLKSLRQDSVKTVTKEKINLDKILGIWEVKNEYCSALYEFEKYSNSYICKIHFYKDEEFAYKLQNNENDYFITDLIFDKSENLFKGKLYLKDGVVGKVIISFKDNNTLNVSLKSTIKAYNEIWKRKTAKE